MECSICLKPIIFINLVASKLLADKAVRVVSSVALRKVEML